MRRIILCGYLNFPRGSAPANYIQYFAKALAEAGYQVYIVSNYNEKEKSYLNSFLSFNQNKISFIPVRFSEKKVIHYIQYNYMLEKKLWKEIKKIGVREEDFVVIYSSRYKDHDYILKKSKSQNVKCGTCIVEWYSKDYFIKKSNWNRYQKMFLQLYPKYDLLFPISTNIESHFWELGVNVFRIPILADSKEYERVPKNLSGKRIFVYPANGRMKDSLNNMITALTLLTEDTLSKLEIHLTGVKEETIKDISKEKYHYIKDSVVIHNWLDYEELIYLYRKAHFLLLARDVNQMTLSNFPSKVPEVMCHGVIPIVSDVGDYTKIYLSNGEEAIFIEGDKPDAIASAINKAMNLSVDQVKELSNNCFSFVEKTLDYSVWSKSLSEKIESLYRGDVNEKEVFYNR